MAPATIVRLATNATAGGQRRRELAVETYRPQKRNKAILARAWEIIGEVPYPVSARWLFYRMLQEGSYTDKKAYKDGFLRTLSKARKRFYGGWRPDTLADDTRRAVWRGAGYAGPGEWLKALRDSSHCTLSKWASQDYYVELWFEANAMRPQFEHYTSHVPLRPFGGDPSIPFKWEIAKHLEWVAEALAKPIVILYFGDLDEKGKTIPTTAEQDIRSWADVDFRFIRCGLNSGHEIEFSLVENPEKPGTYQWEALDDNGARELFQRSLAPFVRHGGGTRARDHRSLPAGL